MEGNYDITIRNTKTGAEVKLWGSARAPDGASHVFGYQPPLLGLGEPERRQDVTNKMMADGALTVPAEQFYNPRQIALTAFAVCLNNTEVQAAIDQFRAAMPIRETVEVIVDTPLGGQYGATFIVLKNSASIAYSNKNRETLVVDRTIELVEVDTVHWYDYLSDINHFQILKPSISGLAWGSDGLDWIAGGLEWGEGGGSTILTNVGDIFYPKIVVYGVIHSPTFSNLTTGEDLRLNLTTSSELDEVVIDCQNERATLNGSDITALVSGDWLSVESGVNNIFFGSDSSNDTDQVFFEWRNSYLEIA